MDDLKRKEDMDREKGIGRERATNIGIIAFFIFGLAVPFFAPALIAMLVGKGLMNYARKDFEEKLGRANACRAKNNALLNARLRPYNAVYEPGRAPQTLCDYQGER